MGLEDRRIRHAAARIDPNRLTGDQAEHLHNGLETLDQIHWTRVALDERERETLDRMASILAVAAG